MKLSSQEFKAWDKKAITLLGMSGVGKTRLSNILRKHHWFHYSSDYRIGTRYLGEAILDDIKQKLMTIPDIKYLLHSDSLQLSNNMTIDNLEIASSFLGKLGNPEQGGLSIKEFKRRQHLHLQSEIAAMKDVPGFIDRAHRVYGYDHFVNDASGSICELESKDILDILSSYTLLLYIKASPRDEEELIERAKESPKPLYYREPFLDKYLQLYLQEKNYEYIALIEPDDFMAWLFPYLFYERLPRYEAIAREYGYTVSMADVTSVQNETDFTELLTDALKRQAS